MSLTSHLKDSQSPVYQFMRERFPQTRAVVRECNKELANVETIRPAMQVPYSTIGTALDYRIRYYFAETPLDKLIAWQSMMNLISGNFMEGSSPQGMISQRELQGQSSGVSEDVYEKMRDLDEPGFRNSLNKALQQLKPIGRRLEREQEELLARYCIVLALFEEIFRAGLHPRSPLIFPSPKTTVNELLATAESHWVDDLCTLSWAFYDEHSDLSSQRTTLNPTFDGSRDMGGADADLIVDGCLIDIKTTINPKLSANWLYQLLGYVLLDYNDRYEIEKVSIYFARQQKLAEWSLESLLRNLSVNEAPPLNELRRQFRDEVKIPSTL